MELTYAIFSIILVLLTVLFVRQYFKRKKDPPGPLGLPFVGGKLFIFIQMLFPSKFSAKSENQNCVEMKKKYGDIWSIDMGDKRIIGLASIDILNEAIVDNGKFFVRRPTMYVLNIINENLGVLFSNAEVWQANRKLAFKAIRDVAIATQQLENIICDEIDDLFLYVENKHGGKLNNSKIFAKSVCNMISVLIFNSKNKYDDREFEDFLKNVGIIYHANEINNLFEFFSKDLPMKYLRKMFHKVDQYMISTEQCVEYIEKKCHSKLKSQDGNLIPNCVFNYFWLYRYQDNPEIDCNEKFHNISYTMFDLFVAGMDTTSILLQFSFLILGQYQDVQEELRKEIHSLVDDNKCIKFDMRKSCPKILSFIDELQRYFAIVPRSIRQPVADCWIRNYKVKSTDLILLDLTTIMRDEKLFKDPYIFDSHRFLDESRSKYIPHRAIVPFGLGKRACLGENIAVMNLFLYLSKIIHRFHISLPIETRNNFNNILDGINGLVHVPMEHEVTIQLRQL